MKNYADKLEKEEYETAADDIDTFRRYTRYWMVWNPELKEKLQRDLDKIELELLEHVRKLADEGIVYLNSVNESNCTKIDTLDSRFQRISRCLGLMGSQKSSFMDEIEKIVKGFIFKVKDLIDIQYSSIVGIISNAKQDSINRSIVDTLGEGFRKLRFFEKMESAGEHARRQLEQVNYNLESYLESQKSLLTKVGDTLENNPQRLKNEVKYVQAALDNMEKLAEFGDDKSVETASRVKKDALKQIEDITQKVQTKMEAIPQLSYTSPKAAEII